MSSEPPVDAKQVIDNETITSDEYYTNPLVSDTSSITGADELTQMIKTLDSSVNPTTAAIIGDRGQSAQNKTTFVSDPFYYEGKLVKFGRFYVTNVEVPQNSSWSGYQDYYENGRLMGFSITCNDPDMIPVCFVENGVGSKDVMNDLSFKEAVWHGRGMTHGEATSTIRTLQGVTSRDVSGIPLTIFPYVSRYKDQFTGTGIYSDIKNTIDDKSYVMNFEPNVFVPYQRLYFDVYNGSGVSSKLINRLEIKRLIYVDPEAEIGAADIKSEFTQFNQNLQSLYDKINSSKKDLNPPVIAAKANLATTVQNDKLYEDFYKYMYDRMNKDNVTKVDLTGKKIQIADLNQQETMQNLLRQINKEDENKPKKRKRKKEDIHDDVMVVSWS